MRALLWAVWLSAAAVTVAHALRPHGLVVHSASSAAVVETAVAGGAMLLAALFFGRWRQRDLVLDLGTCFAFTVLAAGKLWFTVVPLAVGGEVGARVRVAALLCGAVTAVLLGFVALLPGELRLRRTGRLQSLVFLLGVVGTLGL